MRMSRELKMGFLDVPCLSHELLECRSGIMLCIRMSEKPSLILSALRTQNVHNYLRRLNQSCDAVGTCHATYHRQRSPIFVLKH